MFGVEIAGEWLAAVLALVAGAGMGLWSWMLITMVRLTAVVARLEERTEAHAGDLAELAELRAQLAGESAHRHPAGGRRG